MSSALKPLLMFLCGLSVLCGPSLCLTVDREAFSITNYDLNLQIDPQQNRLGARGRITLRNDTQAPQRVVILQISSSLDWRAIKIDDKLLQYVTQTYTSDIDHTGTLSEAIITLPREVPPHSTIDLDIVYEGVIVPDASRLTRIGAPEDLAKSNDWDQIDAGFTAVRGVGYVAWYPILTDVANLSEADSLFEVLSRWRKREASATMHLKVNTLTEPGEHPPELLFNHEGCFFVLRDPPQSKNAVPDCTYQPLGLTVPTFVIGSYGAIERSSITVHLLRGHDTGALEYADAADKAAPLVADWFGPPHEKAQTFDISPEDAAPFESDAFLLTPLSHSNSGSASLAAAHQLTHASISSFRPWINEGLAHFAQALYLEQEKGRPAALDYMGLHRSALIKLESPVASPTSEEEAEQSLINTVNEELYRSKAMCVWWMLRDMVGDTALKKVLANYHPDQDKEPSYIQKLIATQSQRDLEWFFDDWVYRDRGLPDFKVDSAFSRKTMNGSYILTVTVENLGKAGAEVPLIVKFKDGSITKRIEVRAKSKSSIRVEAPAAPQEVVVNDGSVPESDSTNNTYQVEPSKE
jgi:hypothetical protein